MNSTIYLDTGFPNLNRLLTRESKEDGGNGKGIAIPQNGGAGQTSITILSGQTGVGKSVLCSVMAANIMNTQIVDDAEKRVTFVVYFSLSQPIGSLKRYIETIGNTQNLKAEPFIASPKNVSEIVETSGVRTLRRCLLDNLAPLLPLPVHVKPSSDANDNLERIRQFCTTMKNSRKWDIDDYWKDIDWNNDNWKEDIKLKNYKNRKLLPVIFVDPVNPFLHYDDSRLVVAELCETFRHRCPLILTIEAAGSQNQHEQLISNLEYEADVVIHLRNKSDVEHRRQTVEIIKNRNGQPIFGEHMYRIEDFKDYKLWEVITADGKTIKDQSPDSGFIVIPSIHWFHSRHRQRHTKPKSLKTGISDLDDIIKSDVEVLPQDAFVLVRGPKGGHKFCLAFNILCAGLWSRPMRGSSKNRKNTVMLLSLGEEAVISISKIARGSTGTKQQKDNNFTHINWEADARSSVPAGPTEEVPAGPTEDQNQDYREVGKKALVKEWKANITYPSRKNEEGTLVEVNFKPGHLVADEFLYLVEKLFEEYEPSRILVENTAHLRLRFPLLRAERMLFPALSALTHSKNVVFIVTDVLGTGSDEELSYGLRSLADYVMNVNVFDEEPASASIFKEFIDKKQTNDEVYSMLYVRNIRGKNYKGQKKLMTVNEYHQLVIEKWPSQQESEGKTDGK